MKKRLLALALCLVLATSLLPVTVFATENAGGVYYNGPNKICIEEDFVFTYTIDEGLCSGFNFINIQSQSGEEITPAPNNVSQSGQTYTVTIRSAELKSFFQSGDVATLYIGADDVTGFNGEFHFVETQIEFGHIGGTATCCEKAVCSTCGQEYGELDTEAHDWKFTVSKNNDTLTGECQNQGCGEEVSVTLKADSVTLPDNPFNAQLAGKEQFETATGAVISKIRYDYKGSDGVWHKGVDPVSANAKAGEYQAFVQISNLPRPVESDGVVAMAENPDGTYTAELFVKYTAVDPAVTAQTGDNRPIEIMMASVLVFSALAAAAFMLDHKRKSASL